MSAPGTCEATAAVNVASSKIINYGTTRKRIINGASGAESSMAGMAAPIPI